MKPNAKGKDKINAFVDTFVTGMAKDMAGGLVDTMDRLVMESRSEVLLRIERNRGLAIGLVHDALFTSKRIARSKLNPYVPNNKHLTEKELAQELRMPLSELQKALKRWYHFF